LFLIGFVLLIGGAEFLVRGASRLAVAVGISPLVVGLTVVAYGTSTPELAVTVQSALAGQADIAVGNVVGSNISNILLVLGLAAMIGVLAVAPQLIRLDIPLMIFVSLLVLMMGLDGQISRLDGVILTMCALGYTFFVVNKSRQEIKAVELEYIEAAGVKPGEVMGPIQVARQLGLILIGLTLLVVGSNWLINGAVAVAELLGVSKLVIGLTIVAVGTSLPEIATSIIASFRGEKDIAVGNVVGSNIFNILFVLGVTAVIAPAGVAISSAALRFDVPIMILVAMACLPIFLTKYTVERWEGALFFGYYIVYAAYLFLSATQHPFAGPFGTFVIVFALPITAIVLLGALVRYIQHQRQMSLIQPKVATQDGVPPDQF
jgi:cation:H+ antiporter